MTDPLETTARKQSAKVSILAVACFVGLLAGGCGSGSGDDPKPTPLAEEVLLAFGAEFGAALPFGGFVARPLMLRKAGEEPWTEIEVPALLDMAVRGIVFSSPDTAWAFGRREAGLALLRSDDRGQSWRDVSTPLPPLGQTACAFDLVFADEHTAYLAVRTSPFGASPLIFVSRDDGASWHSVDGPTVSFSGNNQALLARNGAIELLRGNDGPPRVEPIDGTPSLAQVLTPFGTVSPASSASTVGARGWAAVTVEPNPTDFAPQPGIFSSVAPGEPWIEQPVESEGFVELHTIDLCSASTGVAGGFGIGATTFHPVILHTVSDGAQWVQSAIVGVPSGTVIQSVLCTRDESAWAITSNVDPGGIGSRFLHSTDSGATWAPAPTSLGERTFLRGFARSTERE